MKITLLQQSPSRFPQQTKRKRIGDLPLDERKYICEDGECITKLEKIKK
jgi:hypothetical protein